MVALVDLLLLADADRSVFLLGVIGVLLVWGCFFLLVLAGFDESSERS